jgi:predicted dehydrogenase
MKRAKIALAGVGGYGSAHVEAAQILAAEGLLEVQAFADPRRHVEAVAQLEAAGARHYLDYNEMLELEEELDAVCIATPIPCHVPMIAAAFDKGLHVFAEKPPAVCIQDLHMLVAKQQQSGCLCAVGYQDIARPAVLALKQRLCDGVLGPIRAIRAECRWQRPARYYSRNDWAGKLERDGVWVLDGPLNNACSHVLNLAAFLAGPAPYEFARPLSVEAELYRANAIESEDTDCLRAKMDTGVELCVHLTQCAALSHPRSWTIIGD